MKTLPALDPRTLAARSKIVAAKRHFGSWRKVAAWLGDTHKATACNRLAKDSAFRPAITLVDLIESATLPPLPALIPVPPCPDCGAVHTGRCHGREIVQVVTLTRAERVTRRPTRIIRRWGDLPRAALAQALAARIPYTAAHR